MARIRTIKPEFFRHEGLQDLAAKEGAHVMLVFAGLWGHCDRAGRFEWRPRQLKLDILPFLEFDMGDALKVLEEAGFIQSYHVDGKMYGLIPSFADHQRFSGKEAQEKEKHPEPPVKQRGSSERFPSGSQAIDIPVKQQGSTGEAPEKHVPAQEGKGVKEREGKGGRASAPLTREASSPSKPELNRELWPPSQPVPESWILGAEAERRRLGKPSIDLAVVAAKFTNHFGAAGNQRRTATEWEAKWMNFALDESKGKSNASGQSGPSQGVASRVFGTA